MRFQHIRRPITRLAFLPILTLALFAPVPTGAQDTVPPEVIAVEDITAEASCEITAEEYADVARTQLTKRQTYPCPPGSVIRANQMSLEEAQSQGLRYVVVTGNFAAVEAAVDEIKAELRGPAAGTSSAASGCEAYYRRYMRYQPGDHDQDPDAPGGLVEVAVDYELNQGNCGATMFITQSRIVFVEDPAPGEDLFWDQEYYSLPVFYQEWDMQCKEVTSSPQYTYMGNWHVEPNGWFTDETINDTSFGCSHWGEEYTGQMILYT